MSPETTADTIGAVDDAVSGAGHEADAGPLAVHVRGEGVGDACAAGDEDAPQLATSGRAAATASTTVVKARFLTIRWSCDLWRAGRVIALSIRVPFGTVDASPPTVWFGRVR